MVLAKDTTQLLKQLRLLMVDTKITSTPLAAYIVPSEDSHHSEYIAACDERRAFISGFTGSAGTAVITETQALLWADGRYYLQASEQIDNNWTLMKQGLPDTPSIASWLSKNLPSSAVVGVQPTLYSKDDFENLSKELNSTGKTLVAVQNNLIDMIWKDQPSRPQEPVNRLGLEYSGQGTVDKLNSVRTKLQEDAGAQVLVVTELDEIAWLLNLRGSDIPYNPVFFAYVIVTPNGFDLFTDSERLSGAVQKELIQEGGTIYPYGKVFEKVAGYVANSTWKVWCSKYCNSAIANLIDPARRVLKLTPIALMKAVKNNVEIEGLKRAHIKDGVALANFFSWLEKAMESGHPLTEISAADKLLEFRKAQDHFVGMSFPSISSSGPNGAIIHYNPSPATDRKLAINEIYLLDSGGQYLDGTTDVTRTMHFGTPTEYQKECFTRVLKGQIALKSAKFPNKVVGNTLDTLARKALWDVGLDYIHGTGHGIGAYLNVHEGPHGVTYRHLPDDPGLRENMFLSNEPGYYESGQFGIRLENIIRIVKAELKYNFANRGYLGFEDITFVPIQRKMMNMDLLTPDEIDYLNDYHRKCLILIGGYMKDTGNMSGYEWLIRETEPLG
jgi:Xaa-Pro aminopeptidase